MKETEAATALRALLNETAGEQRADYVATGWWHSIDLGDGVVTPGAHHIEELRDNYARFNLPDDLTGKRVLDIGCWDGFYSFEAERHGAAVVAVDCWRPENFFKAKQALNSQVEFHELSVYEVTRARLGQFDLIFFLGVLYHLRHPLLALERVCEVARDCVVIESHVSDKLLETALPAMEFYEWDELGGQYDNWWGPNTDCLARLAHAAGFARTEVLRRQPARSVLKAYRSWEPPSAQAQQSLRIRAVTNAINFTRELPQQGRLAFLALWLDGLPLNARRDEVQVEVGGFGISPYFVGPCHSANGAVECMQVNAPVPPGLTPGKTLVRVRCRESISAEQEIELLEGGLW